MFSTGNDRVDERGQLLPAGESPGNHQQGAQLCIQESEKIRKSQSVTMSPAPTHCILALLFSKTGVLRAPDTGLVPLCWWVGTLGQRSQYPRRLYAHQNRISQTAV